MLLTSRFFLIGILLALLSALGYYLPACYEVARVGLVVWGGLVVIDLLSVNFLCRVRAERKLQERFSLGEDNEVKIHLENKGSLPCRIEVRDELPSDWAFHEAIFSVSLQRGEGKTVHYRLQPKQRGAKEFGRIILFVGTPLGMLARKVTSGAAQTVKVYPAFRRLAQLELAAISNDLSLAGIKRIRRIGNSTEFEQIKDYTPGDDFRTINYKASAKVGRWMVNTYRDERAQPVWLLVDEGRVMQRTFNGMQLLDYAINAALALSFVAIRRADMVGLVCFGARPDGIVPADRRTDQLPRLLEALYARRPEYQESDYPALGARLSSLARKRSLMILLTDFSTKTALERELPTLRRLGRRHRLLVVFFADEEVEATAHSADEGLPALKTRALAAGFCQEKRGLVRLLRAHGIDGLLTTPTGLTVDLINRYITLRKQF